MCFTHMGYNFCAYLFDLSAFSATVLISVRVTRLSLFKISDLSSGLSPAVIRITPTLFKA